MKPQYERYSWDCEWKHWRGRYSTKYSYFRAVKTQNENRQNCAALADGYKVRGKRRNLVTAWDDVHISRTWKRSWKDYTKQRKQYHGA